MYSTSGDLLNFVKSLSIVWLTVFGAMFLYYLAMMMRQMFLVIKEMRERVHKVDRLIDSVQEKIDHSASYLLLISEGIKKISEIAKDYWTGDKKKSKKK